MRLIMKNDDIKILVVDDEEDLCEILKFNLEAEGYAVTTAHSAEEALQLDPGSFQLLLLDVMMGGLSGFALARQLRQQEPDRHLPIIFLTARDTETDLLTGFNLGADDYISKPFSIREVLARVRAVLRRVGEPAAPEMPRTLGYEGLVLDLDRKTVSVEGQDVPFTKTEFELLCLLLSEPGRVFSRQELISRVWPSDVLVLNRTVDVNITRIRKKIGGYAGHLVTRLGFGYFFDR